MSLKKVSKLTLSTFLVITLAQGFNITSVQAEENLIKTIKRVQGLDRFKTSRAIAEEIGFDELENVVITSGFGFADGLSASTFAKKLNAPLLLAGDLKSSSEAIAYISNRLKNHGNVYIIGGEGVIGKDTENALTSKGYKITRIFGKGRIETNNAIINELDVAKGTPVFISNALGYADALSASGVAAIKDYPMLLTNADKLPDLIKNKLANINPSKVYVVGGEGVVKPAVVNEIKEIVPSAEIVRLGGNTRYETSMSIFNEFNLDTKNIVLASGKGFADALSGSQLAVKLNAPMVLIDESNLYKQQLKFDEKALENYYLLGGIGSISDNVEQFIIKDMQKEFEDINGVLNRLADAVKLKDIEMYMEDIDPSAPGYKETREVYTEVFQSLIKYEMNVEPIYNSIDIISMDTKEAKVKAVETDKIAYKDKETGEDVTEEETYAIIFTFKNVNGQWKIYSSEMLEEQ